MYNIEENKPCPECKGTGKKEIFDDENIEFHEIGDCEYCNGFGEVSNTEYKMYIKEEMFNRKFDEKE